jgi:hypothetical protein
MILREEFIYREVFAFMENQVLGRPRFYFAVVILIIVAPGLSLSGQESKAVKEPSSADRQVVSSETTADGSTGSAAVPAVRITQISSTPSTGETAAPRVANNASGLIAPSKSSEAATRSPHPLDRAIAIAEDSLTRMKCDVKDYTGLFYRRECFEGVKTEPGYMQLKIRCPRQVETANVPFSIYMKFLKPRQSAGRECIWVDGINESKIVAHEARGLIGMRRFYLEPRGMLAMRESRYPIYEAGIENLIRKLIEKAERDRAVGPCDVVIKDNCEVNGRKCSMIQVTHAEKKEPYDFHMARVFIDQETHLPIAYAAYDWPATPGAKPPLIEEYHYLNLKINVGLTDHDFSADNPNYGYPSR